MKKLVILILCLLLTLLATSCGTLRIFNTTKAVDGKSAYELAVENGYTGTVEEWLASLVGETGKNGKSAYELAVSKGYKGTESEWLTSLIGKNGENGSNGARLRATKQQFCTVCRFIAIAFHQ